MKEKIIQGIGDKIKHLQLHVDDVVYEKEDGHNYLKICLDGDIPLDVEVITKASKIINPIIDELDLIDESYILYIYGKSKGSIE